jgi:RHS repeat-associated protein
MLTKIYIDPAGAEPKEDYILEYDVMQRPTITKKKIGVEQLNEVTIQKSYDSAGRVVSITYPGNHVYSYEYDVAGNLKNLKDNTGASVVEYSGFTALGQPGLATFSNGVGTDYDYYSETGRLKTLQTNGPGYEFYQNSEYWYDGNGNITIIQEKNDNGSTRILHSYGYDALDRLGTAAGSGADVYSRIYLYDKIGNITSKSDVGSYHYDPYGTRPHAVKSVLATNPIYEQVPEINIVYDFDQKPTVVQKWNETDWVDYVRLTYDGNGQRVKKENLQTSPNQVALYFGDLYEKRIGEQTFKILHLFAGNRRVASIWLDNTTGNVLFQQFYHPDHLGSTNIVTDQNGNKKERNEFFPFGTYRVEEENDPNFPNVFYTYTGQEDDFELGLFNYKARLYDPLLGRFISPDPLVQDTEDPQSFNHYSYVRNNPLVMVDPEGMAWEPTYDDWYGGPAGYLWVSPEESYVDDNGTLREGLYNQAIFFTENGNFNPYSSYNIGSSTAYVYKADGTIETFRAATYPSDLYKYATVQEGGFDAVVGMHKTPQTGGYMALRMSDVGESDRRMELGRPHPNPLYGGRTFAEGVDIHKAGQNNFTGIGRDGRPVSTACLLIDSNRWDSFIRIFNNPQQRVNPVSVSVSGTYAAPINIYGIGGPLRTIDSRTISSIYR